MEPVRPDPGYDQCEQEAQTAQASVTGAPAMDGFVFLVDPPVRCWVAPDRTVVTELQGTVWDADTLAMSIALGMEVGPWVQHVRRLQRYLDAAPELSAEEVVCAGRGPASARGSRARQQPHLAAMFATDPISRVRSAAAYAATDPDLLAVLVGDRVDLVRKAVAGNAHTRVGDLVVLACDEHPNVRAKVATNPLCPQAMLDVLATDRRATVRDAVLRRERQRNLDSWDTLLGSG